MSKIDNNPLLKGASGMLGETMVFRTVRGQLQMANRPKRRTNISEKQAAVQTKFQEAAQYATQQLSQEASSALYEAGITSKKHSAYLVAVSDYLNAPKVHFIEAIGYRGNVGDTITVKATDDFMVTGLKIVIKGSDGAILEEGEAEPDLEKINLWTYKTTVANPSVPGTSIKATAFDRPGNSTSLEKVV